MGAPNDYYVHATEGSDATGDGSIGNPFATCLGALAVVTQDSTNGDRFNVTGDVVMTNTLASGRPAYGTPTAKAPLIWNGLNGGGMNGNGTYSISGAYGDNQYTHFIDLWLHNCGSNNVVEVDCGTVIGCEVDNNSGSYKYGIYLRGYSLAINNNVHDVNVGIYAYNDSSVFWNYLKDIDGVHALYLTMYGTIARHNIISVSGSTNGIYSYERQEISNNTILSAGGTGSGIIARVSNPEHAITNNYIEGFSGAGGVGINTEDHANSAAQYMIGSNAVFNCATAYNIKAADYILNAGDNEILPSSAIARKGSDIFDDRFEYYRPLKIGNVPSGGYPVGSRMFKGAVPPKFAVSVPQMIHAGVGVL